MSNVKSKRCGECGSKELELREQKAKPFAFKDYPAVILNESLELLECRACGNLVVNQKQIRELDKALERTIKNDVVSFIVELLQREKLSIKELGRFTGLTREYLSKLKAGKTLPKFQTYNLLKLLYISRSTFKQANPSYDGFRKTSA